MAIHKVRRLRFRHFRPPPVRAHTLLAYTTSPPSRSVRILFFKEGIYFANSINQRTTNNVTK